VPAKYYIPNKLKTISTLVYDKFKFSVLNLSDPWKIQCSLCQQTWEDAKKIIREYKLDKPMKSTYLSKIKLVKKQINVMKQWCGLQSTTLSLQTKFHLHKPVSIGKEL
jgi:hypothetical protein